MKHCSLFVALVLLSFGIACTETPEGPPMDKVFAAHQAQLDECLGYRLDAEQKQAHASRVLDSGLASASAKADARVQKSLAATLGLTHDACVTRLLEAAAVTAAAEGVTAEELKGAWPEWYDLRALAATPK